MTGGAAEEPLRLGLVATCQKLTSSGLTHGTSGNVSVRRDHSHFFISPSGMAYDALVAQDIPLVGLDGCWYGLRRPSSEWRFHRDIYRARSEASAIVHTHSRHATALACTGRGIPAFHYMVAAAGGADIRCAPYHTFGSQALSDAAVAALEGRNACLLANHGVITIGADLAAALSLAAEVENLAAKYCTALAIEQVQILSDDEMQRVIEKFGTYGRQDAPDGELSFNGSHLPVSSTTAR